MIEVANDAGFRIDYSYAGNTAAGKTDWGQRRIAYVWLVNSLRNQGPCPAASSSICEVWINEGVV